MPKDKTQESGITITIRSSMNGFTVDGHPAGNHPMEDDVSYVYKTIEQVVKELPSIYSVLSEDSDPKTEEDLDNLEEEANEAGKE